MKAVNLVPKDARGGRGSSSRGGAGRVGFNGLGPAHVVVGVLVIVVGLILLRVLANNDVNNQKATLAAVQTQVATEQADASKLSVYTSFVQAAQQREDQVREIAEQRFPWQRILDQLSRVMPATTSLTSLSASTNGSPGTASTSAGTAVTSAAGPTFSLAGCADTRNQNGVATLLRRLQVLSDVTNVGFQSSSRQASCGNSFNLTLSFAEPGTSTAATSSVSAATATATTPAATTTPGATTG
jgi:Tfp pilus assembly protein PilN